MFLGHHHLQDGDMLQPPSVFTPEFKLKIRYWLDDARYALWRYGVAALASIGAFTLAIVATGIAFAYFDDGMRNEGRLRIPPRLDAPSAQSTQPPILLPSAQPLPFELPHPPSLSSAAQAPHAPTPLIAPVDLSPLKAAPPAMQPATLTITLGGNTVDLSLTASEHYSIDVDHKSGCIGMAMPDSPSGDEIGIRLCPPAAARPAIGDVSAFSMPPTDAAPPRPIPSPTSQ